MECDNVSINAYHGTCSKHQTSIEEYGLDPSKVNYRDDHWLGQGVYFFDEFDKAQWWACDQSSKRWNQGTFPIVYKSQILADKDKVLNLNNPSELDKFYDVILESFSEIEKSDKYPIFDSKTCRAVYFDYYKIQNNISVIIYTFGKDSAKYSKERNSCDLNKVKRLAHDLGLFYRETQICVSDKECIKETELVYNGDDEVI